MIINILGNNTGTKKCDNIWSIYYHLSKLVLVQTLSANKDTGYSSPGSLFSKPFNNLWK